MKIGLVCPYNMFRGGGVQECVMALRNGIELRGNEAYIVTPQPSDYKDKAPDNVIFVGGARPFRSFHTSAEVSASVDIDSLEDMLESEQFDILHFHEPWVPMLSRQILSRSNAINIGTFHAALPDRRMTRTIERVITPYTKSILSYLDVLTAVSPAATTYVKSLTKRRVNIIANGIDLSRYKFNDRADSASHSKRTILYIGRLEKRKGVRYLLKAFGALQAKSPGGYRLLIAGDGPERSKLEDLVEDNKIEGVNFLGYVSEEQKLKLLRSADVFCSPALYGESFGIVLLEAMASGCVVVAGNNPGYEAVLRGRGQLSIVNPKDSEEFARRLLLLASDETLKKAWREWAKREVEQYNYDTIIDRYVRLYEVAYAQKYHG